MSRGRGCLAEVNAYQCWTTVSLHLKLQYEEFRVTKTSSRCLGNWSLRRGCLHKGLDYRVFKHGNVSSEHLYFLLAITKDVLISSHTRYDTTIVNSFRPESSGVGFKLYFYFSIRRRPRANIVKEENSKRESRKCNKEWRPENSHWFYFIRRHEQQGEQSFPPTVWWFSLPALACSFCLK